MHYLSKALALSSIVLLFSCVNSEKTEIKSTYPSGEKKVVYILKELDNEEYVRSGERHFYEGGQMELEGFYDQEGLRQGRWKYWYPDGTLWSICDYTEGKKDGVSKVYYESGKLRYEGSYMMDKKKGKWKFYDQNGNLTDQKSH